MTDRGPGTDLVQWQEICTKLKHAQAGDVLWILDSLFSLAWPTDVPADQLGLVISALCSLLHRSRAKLGIVHSRFLHFVQTVFSKQSVWLSCSQLEQLVAYFLALLQGRDGAVRVEGLCALAAILGEHSNRANLQLIITSLLPFCRRFDLKGAARETPEVARAAYEVIRQASIKNGSKLGALFASLLDHYQSQLQHYTQESWLRDLDSTGVLKEVKVLVSLLRSLQIVLGEAGSYKQLPLALPPFLTSLRHLLAFHTNVVAPPRLGGAASTAGSDSESQTDGDNQEEVGWKVRVAALACIATVARSHSKLFYNHWTTFLPSSAAPSSPLPTLLSLLGQDPSMKVRMNALFCLGAMLEGSRIYWQALDESAKPSHTFTSFSATLLSMLKLLHSSLWEVLVPGGKSPNLSLSQTGLIAQALKTLSLLTANVPYERLSPGLVTYSLRCCMSLLQHPDPQVRVCSLACLSSIVATRAHLSELPPLLVSSPSSVIPTLLEIANDTRASYAVRTEALLCLSAACKNYWRSLARFVSLPLLSQLVAWIHQPAATTPACTVAIASTAAPMAVVDAIQEANFRLAAAKLIEEFLRAVAALFGGTQQFASGDDEEEEKSEPKHNRGPPQKQLSGEGEGDKLEASCPLTQADVVQMWKQLLESNWTRALHDLTHHPLRMTICTTFSYLPAAVYQQLPTHLRLLCMTLPLSCADGDEVASVRAAACRTLGVLIAFPSLQQDAVFMADTMHALLTCMGDSNLNVRVKAIWSLANLADTWVKREGQSEVGPAILGDDSLQEVIQAVLKAAYDHDKVRSNAVRALGNLSRVVPISFLGPFLPDTTNAFTTNLNTGSVKVRWNASYAISNLLRNQHFASGFLDPDQLTCVNKLIESLLSAMKNRNFKIRINAALALAQTRGYQYTPDSFLSACRAVLQGLNTKEDMPDSTQFRYRATLEQQLRTTLLHLLTQIRNEHITPALIELCTSPESSSLLISAFHKADSSSDVELARSKLVAILKSRPGYENLESQLFAASNLNPVQITAVH